MVLEQMDIHMQKSVSVNQSRHRPYTLHKTNLRWSIDLNTKFRTIKLLEDNIRENLPTLQHSGKGKTMEAVKRLRVVRN